MNRRNQTTNKFRSKYKGVSYDLERNKYVVKVYLNTKAHFGGRFSTEKEAALAYNKLASKLHGEYARLNIIEEG